MSLIDINNQISWSKLKRDFKETSFLSYSDSMLVTSKHFKSAFCWDTPLKYMQPETMKLIFALEDRISKLEDELNEFKRCFE